MDNLANEVAKLAVQEVVGNGFRHLVWLVIGMLGIGFIGRRYRLMRREIEELKQRPPITVNVGKADEFDPAAIARELDKIYTQRQAEAILRVVRAEMRDDEE